MIYKVRWQASDDNQVYELNFDDEATAEKEAAALSKKNPVANVAAIGDDDKVGKVKIFVKGKLDEERDYTDRQEELNDPEVTNIDDPANPVTVKPKKAPKKAKEAPKPQAATTLPKTPKKPAGTHNPVDGSTNEGDTDMASKTANKAKAEKAIPKKTVEVKKSKKVAGKNVPKTVGLPEKGVAKKTGEVKKKLTKAGAIVAEFGAREGTIRAQLIHLLAESVNKPVATEDIQQALYGRTDKSSAGALSMVLKGMRDMIKKGGLGYEVQSTTVGSVPHLKLVTK
jgi:hypothetical protein